MAPVFHKDQVLLSSSPTPGSHEGLCQEHARAQQSSTLQCSEKAQNSSPVCKSCLCQVLSLCSSLSPISRSSPGALAGTRGDCRSWVLAKQVLHWQPTRLVGPRNSPTLWEGEALGARGPTGVCSCRAYAVHKPCQACCWERKCFKQPQHCGNLRKQLTLSQV